ncbi:NADH:flavin oxidoreductase [Clostridium fermenticellae]|uniref:NADH:flavin oxidoreductase n=1 Tax=Clostridium fermenticellae TaxID=2068654 RepID=A0A386H498_9CLOT|nr:NADH:flavin oxidoreductase [Clostridium fermenticellae]AYD40549.1 NADH:flavin oxidoreductase [Clostridium fermenticellae]
MNSLFDVTKINNMELKNRFVRSATYEGKACKDGHITEELFDLYKDLAKGGTGLIITSYTTVFKDDKPAPRILGIYDNSFIEEYKKLTDMVHSNNCKIIMQIVHGREYINRKRGIESPGLTNDMSKEDINNIVKAFGEAAYRVKEANFDGVEIHAAHGYYLNMSLSPLYNNRIDEYGGSIENRARLILDVYDEIRKKVGSDFNIFIKLNCSDFKVGGASFDDCKYVCRELDKRGINAIEISGGDRIWEKETNKESVYKDYAEEVAEEIEAPVILVGVNRNICNMDRILSTSKIQYFSMARPFVCEPDLINKWVNGLTTKSKCVSCGNCFKNNKNCILNL